jgi:large subunit ribosomal protein L15
MQIHQLKPKTKWKSKKRVGRGGIKGTYSGRGIKGQVSRAGRKLPPIVRSVIKRYPKLRGYRFNSLQNKPALVDLSLLEKKFDDGAKILPKDILEKKLVRNINGRVQLIKILAKGEIKKKLFIEGCFFSKKAIEKIEKAGGKATPLVIVKKVKEKKKRIRKEKPIGEVKVEKKEEKPKTVKKEAAPKKKPIKAVKK